MHRKELSSNRKYVVTSTYAASHCTKLEHNVGTCMPQRYPYRMHLKGEKGSSGVRIAEATRHRNLWGRAGYHADLGSIRLFNFHAKIQPRHLLFVIAIVFHYHHLECGVNGFISNASDSFVHFRHPLLLLHWTNPPAFPIEISLNFSKPSLLTACLPVSFSTPPPPWPHKVISPTTM
jgi:hypothetical protein